MKVSRPWSPHAPGGVSRRGVVWAALLIGLGGAAMVSPAAAKVACRLPAAVGARKRVVVAYHDGRLYLDDAGAEPYVPPPGLRSLDGLDEDALRRLVYAL